VSYNSRPREETFPDAFYAEIGDEPMKRAIRIAILMVGVAITFVAASVQQVPAQDGGPLPLCEPGRNCSQQGK